MDININYFLESLVKYNLDSKIYLTIYFGSIVPIYLGLFFMFKKIGFKKFIRDICRLNFRNIFSVPRGGLFLIGLVLFIFGWLAPYLYVLIFIRNVSFWVYIGIIIFFSISTILLFKGRNNHNINSQNTASIKMVKCIDDLVIASKLWEIYSSSFMVVNKIAPCQQSIKDRYLFIEDMKNISIFKYLLYVKGEVVGLGLITNELKNCTWISEDFFSHHYKELYDSKKIYYFMGIVVDLKYRKMGYSKKILNKIMTSIPIDSVIGFDHSYRVNRFIPYFTRMMRFGGRSLKNIYLDKQVYYLVKLKK